MNLRPSGYEPDELPGCSIPRFFVCPIAYRLFEDSFCPTARWGFWTFPQFIRFCVFWVFFGIVLEIIWVFIRFGGALLSHTLRCSTIGATLLNFRVRDGTGCFSCAIATKPNKDPNDAFACRRCRAAGRVFTQ